MPPVCRSGGRGRGAVRDDPAAGRAERLERCFARDDAGAVTPDRVRSLPFPHPDRIHRQQENRRGNEKTKTEMKIAYRIAVRPPQGGGLRPRASCARPCPGRPGRGAGGVFQKPMREGHPDEHQRTNRTGNRGGKTNRAPRDHYQEVTDRIIAALEAGTPPWRKPWDPDKAGGPAMPRNAATGQRYRGINVLTLGMSRPGLQQRRSALGDLQAGRRPWLAGAQGRARHDRRISSNGSKCATTAQAGR